MKKSIRVLATATAAILALSACATPEKAAQPSPAASGQTTAGATAKPKSNKTITMGSHQSGIPTSGVVQTLMKKYETETGVKIDLQLSPDAQWRDLLKVKLNSNEAPDIFCADADPLSIYSRVRPDENCIDLSKEEFVSRMADYVKPSISYQGKVYGITFNEKKTWVYTYNKDIFAKAGVVPPKTYAEFKAVAQKIKDTGITPVFEATTNGWHQVLPLFETGPMYEAKDPGLYDALNKNTKKIKDIPDLLTIITQLDEFGKLGFYGKNYLSNSVEQGDAEMGTGKVAMMLNGPGFSLKLETKYPEMKGKYGIFVSPFGDSQYLGINPANNTYFANSKGKNKDEVLDFFRFLAKKENLQYRIDNDPGTLGLAWPEIATKYPKEFDDYLKTLKSGTVMQVGVKYIDPQWMETGKDLEAMYAGSMTPQQVITQIETRRESQAKLQKDESWK